MSDATNSQSPSTITWNDGLRHRSRHVKLIIGYGEFIYDFAGQSIPGVAAVLDAQYQKNGKWSNTTYTIALREGAWSLPVSQSFEEGNYFARCRSVSDACALLIEAGCKASLENITTFLRREYPKTCERLDKIELDYQSLLS